MSKCLKAYPFKLSPKHSKGTCDAYKLKTSHFLTRGLNATGAKPLAIANALYTTFWLTSANKSNEAFMYQWRWQFHCPLWKSVKTITEYQECPQATSNKQKYNPIQQINNMFINAMFIRYICSDLVYVFVSWIDQTSVPGHHWHRCATQLLSHCQCVRWMLLHWCSCVTPCVAHSAAESKVMCTGGRKHTECCSVGFPVFVVMWKCIQQSESVTYCDNQRKLCALQL